MQPQRPSRLRHALALLPDLSDVLILAGLLVLIHVLWALSHLGAEAFVGLLLAGLGIARSGLLPRRMGDDE